MSDALEEHIGYLSDAIRLARFEEAIARVIREGDTVADVGCGVGVLGVFCLKAGAAHVWGIDSTLAIELARGTMERAGLAERYTCLHMVSRRAILPQRVDAVICDHVGYFGFDYGIIETLGDARRRFLKPGGTVIPAQLVLCLAGVQSPDCRALAEAWRREPVPSEFHWIGDYGVNSKHAYSHGPEEIATHAAEFGTIDLRTDAPERYRFAASLTVEREGMLDGLAGWFRCEIADGVWMTNSPLAQDRIKRSQAFLPFAIPLEVRAGDKVEVTLSIRPADGVLAWTAKVARTGAVAKQSNWAGLILDPRDRLVPDDRVPRLSDAGRARQALLALVDGKTPRSELERAIVTAFPDLHPTPSEVVQFVRGELARSSE